MIGCMPVLEQNNNVALQLNSQNGNVQELASWLRLVGPQSTMMLNNPGMIETVTTSRYWNGSHYLPPDTGYYVPYTQDGNGDLVIHKQQFPCPAGTYGTGETYEAYGYPEYKTCTRCRHDQYQDEEGQLSCK